VAPDHPLPLAGPADDPVPQATPIAGRSKCFQQEVA
jgi:hypothetical protein